LTNNSITAKQIKIGDDKNFDKIPENMWFLDQLKKHLNSKKSPMKQSAALKVMEPKAESEPSPAVNVA